MYINQAENDLRDSFHPTMHWTTITLNFNPRANDQWNYVARTNSVEARVVETRLSCVRLSWRGYKLLGEN